MRSRLRLTFAVILVCSASAWPSTLRQEQGPQPASPDQNTQQESQPTTTPPTEPAPPAANSPASPTTTTGEKASPAPKPPVLKHRKRKIHHSSSVRKETPAANPNGDPSKVVVRNGGAKEGSAQLAPAVNPAQAQSQRANTASLLAATDANLKRVAGRQLTRAQQSMVDEINTYIRQAKAAAASADTNRAQTLAYKAHLLSNELARK
jgi:cytoskeletal protein RodZ